jgi:hypothetical protein
VVAIDEYGSRTSGPIWGLTTEEIFPDLAITSLAVDDLTPPFEGMIHATLNLQNQGNEDCGGTFLHFYIESLDNSASYLVTRVAVPPLAIGAATVLEAPLQLPANFVGLHLLVARLNKNNSIR